MICPILTRFVRCSIFLSISSILWLCKHFHGFHFLEHCACLVPVSISSTLSSKGDDDGPMSTDTLVEDISTGAGPPLPDWSREPMAVAPLSH